MHRAVKSLVFAHVREAEEVLDQLLAGLLHRLNGSDRAVGPNLYHQAFEVRVLTHASALDGVVHLAHRRVYRVDR